MTDQKTWIMETPDNGKTITRRRFNDHGFKQVLIGSEWWNMQKMILFIREYTNEQELAERYPAVKAAWEDYQTVLKLAETQDQHGQSND